MGGDKVSRPQLPLSHYAHQGNIQPLLYPRKKNSPLRHRNYWSSALIAVKHTTPDTHTYSPLEARLMATLSQHDAHTHSAHTLN